MKFGNLRKFYMVCRGSLKYFKEIMVSMFYFWLSNFKENFVEW